MYKRKSSALRGIVVHARALVSICCFLGCCRRFPSVHAKVINAESSSTYATKLVAGLQQSLDWLSDAALSSIGAFHPEGRPPKQVQAVLVGLGRTGTTSFVTALKDLGFTPIHDDEIPEVADLYRDMFDSTISFEEFHQGLGERGFDVPAVSTREYVRWLGTDAASDIKVILTMRDASKWAESWLSVVDTGFLTDQRPFCWVPYMHAINEYNKYVMLDLPTNGHPESYNDIPTLEAGFDAWSKFVMDTIPPDRLLVFSVKQGWQPLGDFLGKPVPDRDFPHINDRAVVDIIIKVFKIVTWIWPLLFAMPFTMLYFVFTRCFGGKNGAKDGRKKTN